MEIGTGIALSTLFVSIGGVGISAIIKFKPNGNGSSNGKQTGNIVFKDVCEERHRTIEAKIQGLENTIKVRFDAFENKMDSALKKIK